MGSNRDEKLTGSDELDLFVIGDPGSKLVCSGNLSFVARKSVKDLEFPSLRPGGLRVADLPGNSNALGLCNARGESMDERPDIGLLICISIGAVGKASLFGLPPGMDC